MHKIRPDMNNFNLNYREFYKGNLKDVRIESKKYKAFYPKKHSEVNAIILESANENSVDIFEWNTLCRVLYKGEKKWSTLYEGNKHYFSIKGIRVLELNVYYALFLLENERTKKSILRKAEKRLEELCN